MPGIIWMLGHSHRALGMRLNSRHAAAWEAVEAVGTGQGSAILGASSASSAETRVWARGLCSACFSSSNPQQQGHFSGLPLLEVIHSPKRSGKLQNYFKNFKITFITVCFIIVLLLVVVGSLLLCLIYRLTFIIGIKTGYIASTGGLGAYREGLLHALGVLSTLPSVALTILASLLSIFINNFTEHHFPFRQCLVKFQGIFSPAVFPCTREAC